MSDARALALLKAMAWPAAGAVVGMGVGYAAGNPGVLPGALSTMGLVGLVAGAGGVTYWTVRRRRLDRKAVRAKGGERVPRKDAAAPGADAPPPPPPVVKLAFEGVPEGFPDVWGVNDALVLRVNVTRVGRPLGGAPVQVTTEGRTVAEGITDEAGLFQAAVVFDRPGTRRIRTEAVVDAVAGVVEREVRVVRYPDEISRLVNDLRAWAHENLPGGHGAMTLREVSDALGRKAPAAGKAAAEITLIFEIVEYGEREANRALYERLIHAFHALESGGALALPKPGPEEASTGA